MSSARITAHDAAAAAPQQQAPHPFLVILAEHWEVAKAVVPYLLALAGILVAMYTRQAVTDAKVDQLSTQATQTQTEISAIRHDLDLLTGRFSPK